MPSMPTIACASAWSSQRRSSSPNPCWRRLGNLGQAPGPLGLGAGRVHRAALGEVAVDALGCSRGADQVDGVLHGPCAWRPWRLGRTWRTSAPSETANNAEHQPPLRPEAPNPATSFSTTAMRSVGSAVISEWAVHSPVKPAPTMQTSTCRSLASAGRSGNGVGMASHQRERSRSAPSGLLTPGARPRSTPHAVSRPCSRSPRCRR